MASSLEVEEQPVMMTEEYVVVSGGGGITHGQVALAGHTGHVNRRVP